MSTATDRLDEANSATFTHTSASLRYIVTHVFFPPRPPQKGDYTPENALSLARAVCTAAHAYDTQVDGNSEQAQWRYITRMLDNLQSSLQSEHLDRDHVISQLRNMLVGDTLAFFVRRQNAGFVFTKRNSHTMCEAFEVSPSEDAIRYSQEPLKCSYPGSAIEMSNEMFGDEDFQFELANFLSRPGDIRSDTLLPPPTDSQYIDTVLDGILGGLNRIDGITHVTKDGVSRIADILFHLSKRVRDNICSSGMSMNDEPMDVWRRSPLWIFIRVTIQMMINRSLGPAPYKIFMLFFMCTLANDPSVTTLSRDLLHLMSSKIQRRLSKLGPSASHCSKMALSTWISLQGILDARWEVLNAHPSPFQNPSQDDLIRDTCLSLQYSGEYIQNALANTSHTIISAPFHPDHRRRGTIEDFLSLDGSFFEEAHHADSDVTLYDFERSVEEGIDDWFASVTNMDEACVQLEILMDKYLHSSSRMHRLSPEDASIQCLTVVELYVVLDKLAVKGTPMLIDYPPEIPIIFLEGLLLRKRTSLHRLSCAYQYLSARHSQSRSGQPVLSNEFTDVSFPIRYYDQSPVLQQLKARIEEDALKKAAECVGPNLDGASLPQVYQEYQRHQPRQQLFECVQSPLPASLLHAKVVVFELQCPMHIRIWRSAASRILSRFHIYNDFNDYPRNVEHRCDPLARVPGLQDYIVERQGPPLREQIQLVFFYPEGSQSQDRPELRYALVRPKSLEIWEPRRTPFSRTYQLHDHHGCSSCRDLAKYVDHTSHTSNDVLSAQADSPPDLSLDEFITFAHLRSGGSLQWLNILQGLRNRTLNLRRHQVHFLISHAAFQVGPLDLSTGVWTWHQELQDPCFCNALLDELDSLVADVGAHSIDGVLMNTISLLLSRVLASSPSEVCSDRAIKLLRNARRKVFGWVQELSYDLARAPMNTERMDLLRDMVTICRSTFDVDLDILHKLFHSAEDIDVLLSGIFFIHAFGGPHSNDKYTRLLLARDIQLSHHVEETLRDAILADPSDYGIDLAVCKIFPSHVPGRRRWEALQYPNSRWFTYETEAKGDNASQRVHINLLDGILRVAGQQLGGLPHHVWRSPGYRQIFSDQGFFVVPSSLPGMDFTTLAATSAYKVYFSLRDDNLVVRAQGNQTKDMLELIPSSKIMKDLPPTLIIGHVHWLNLSTKMIEIRPLKRLWEESSENWRIDCSSGQYHLFKGRETLVDIRSPTWAMISRCFARLTNLENTNTWWRSHGEYLESECKNLLVTTSPIESTLELRLFVTLPRYSLHFFVNRGEELESRDFKDMVYDEDQCIGTLFGLENLLVLRPKTHIAGTLVPEGLVPRRVLIPNGSPKSDGDRRLHIDIEDLPSDWRTRDQPLYYTYNVDTELGCLLGNGNLASTHYLAYLHAMSSCHRPDPLTGETGVQGALRLYKSGGYRSTMTPRVYDESWDVLLYSELRTAYKEFRSVCYWNHTARDYEAVVAAEKRALQLPADLPPPDAAGPTSPSSLDHATLPHSISSFSQRSLRQVSLDQLLSSRSAPNLPARSALRRESHNIPSDVISALDRLFSSLPADSSFQRKYLAHLHTSAQCVTVESRTVRKVAGDNRIEALKKHFVQCRVKYLESLDVLKRSLGPTLDPREQALDRFGQWPAITANILLRYLASTSLVEIPPRWKKCLVSLALLLLDLQRARRLLRLALDGLEEEFAKELENECCDGWNAEEYPDWLLIQIQGNFLIRRAQAETAMEMISPPSGENTVMQINMGEGKSSVIIPIVAAALADGNQLARVIVPKSMIAQVFELLVARLGGLTNRPIYHLPFCRTPERSRSGIPIDFKIDVLSELMSECMSECGILLVQPEHVVSLKLMSVEKQIYEGEMTCNAHSVQRVQNSFYRLITTPRLFRSLLGGMLRWLNHPSDTPSTMSTIQDDGHDKRSENDRDLGASEWTILQTWIDSHTRDILDESDEVLHARFQLVYTIGPQQHMDGYPYRWTITQQVLRLAKRHVKPLSRYAPEAIEYEPGTPGSFPYVRILRAFDVGQRLISLIAEDVMAGRLPSFDFRHAPPDLHDAIRSFISDEDILKVPDTARRVEEYAKHSDKSHLWSGLLLLRGLLTSNILLFALAERRWRVDYGLIPQPRPDTGHLGNDAPTLTMLAVPYRAKDVPAVNTQFGHPDLTIILTCLSYYYTGLTKEQLKVCFEVLLDQDDPPAQYALWIEECESLPESLHKLCDINLVSLEQWDSVIFPYFAWNQAAIDFYLSRVVFPKEAKEYPSKLSGSSWDLAEKRGKLITGFSGTNDARWLLPMSIAQRDPDHQRGTNARVLADLLRPENDFYMVAYEAEKRWNTDAFLQLVVIQEPKICVLLDVGSQILDFSNRQVAAAWLEINRDAAAAVYVSDHDELVVLTRNGTAVPMSSSPFCHQLDRCVVYLDHAHTRGTDVKLPVGSRAAVTLGPKVTKDALVQGCMRMRKIGHGHSVMFFAPPEVDRSIRALAHKEDPSADVTTVDVLCWAIHETCSEIQQRAPYWAQQGMNHKSRYDAWSRFSNDDLTVEQLLDAWIQPELKSLGNLYAPSESKSVDGSDLSTLDPGIRQRCKDLGVLSFSNAQMEEEQEREVYREREREREIELPPKAEPTEHFLHSDVVTFVKTGNIPPLHCGGAFLPVFSALEKSSAATREANVWSSSILATADFCKTIKPGSTQGTVDQYLRPVQWILSSQIGGSEVLVLLSPFEADRLMPVIRESEHVHLHVYAPRTSERMRPSDDLRFYSIPPLPCDWTPPWHLIDQLNVYAGQLYLRNYESYLRLCRFLGVPTGETDPRSPDDTIVWWNRFDLPGSFEETEITFEGSPLPSVMALLAIRSKGRPFAQTHMGKILQGQLLTKKDF